MALVLFLAAALALPCAARALPPGPPLPEALAEPLARDPMRVTVHRLPNGLTVYLSPNDQEPRLTAWIAVRAGGAQDPADSTGMAHYLEHMLFKGSRRLGTLDYEKERPHLKRIQALYERLFKTEDPEARARIYEEIDEENQKASRYAVPNEMDKIYRALGVRGVNAFTSKEVTVYVCDLPKNRLEAWARLEGDRFARPVFRLFQGEIETVYEEKNRSLDNPDRILRKALERALYGSHPYGRTVLGTIEHLKNPSLAKMYAFYDRHYVPNNMAVALAGDFDREEALAVLTKHLGSWEPRALPGRPDRPVPRPRGTRRVEVRYEAEEQVVLAWSAVDQSHPDADALTVMDMVFDNAEAGLANLRLNQAQRVKRSGSWPDLRNEAGAWHAYAVPKEGQTLEQAEALLLETVEALKRGEFSAEDLAGIITDFEIREKEGLESNQHRVEAMADSFLSYQEWAYRVDRLKRLRGVSKEDVVGVARKYLGSDRVAVYRRKGKPEIPSIQKPEFSELAIEPGRQSEFFSELMAMPAEPIEPKWLEEGRDYRVLDLPSGRLYAAKNPVNDLFELGFHFDRGLRQERTLCEALALWELSGAGEMTAEEFKRRLYRRGLKLGSYCSEDSAGVVLRGLESRLEEGLKLMRLRFERPHVADDTLKKMVEVRIGAHKDNKLNPGYVAHALAEYAQRGRDSAVYAELADDELRALKEEELKRILSGVFAFERRTTYVGKREAEAVGRLVAEPDRKYRKPPARAPKTYVKPEGPRVVFAHRDMVQSQVGLYAADGVLDVSAYPHYSMYGSYMGGGMSSVVFQEIREARSLAYSAWGGYLPGSEAGDENRLAGRLGCQADKTVEAAVLLHRLLKEPPLSLERLEEARKAILEGYRTNPVLFRAVPGTVIAWERQGIGKDPRPWRMERVAAYGLEDLGRFAAGLKDKPVTVYILGHRDRVDLEGLKALGTLVEKTVDDLFPY